MIRNSIFAVSAFFCIPLSCLYEPEPVETEKRIAATWSLIESHDLCLSDSTNSPDTVKRAYHIDSFFVITRDSIYWYDKGTCPEISVREDTGEICMFADWFCGAYTLDGDSLRGKMWEGKREYKGEEVRWCTTIHVTGKKLTLKRFVWSENKPGHQLIWRKRIFE